MGTIFQKNAITEPALFTPFDTTKKIEDFPEICVSTFSENIIQKFASLKSVEKIAELYTANGALPVYKIYYKNQDIAFYLSRVGAPACVAGFEEVVAMGAKKFVMFGSCGVLDDEKVKDNMIIPVSAVRDEGTSYHYIAPSEEIKASEHSIRILQNVLEFCGYSYVKGKTWTSDAITEKPFQRLRNAGKKAVLRLKWNVHLCWQFHNTGRFHLYNFCMGRIVSVRKNGKFEIWNCMDLRMLRNTCC